MEMVVDMKDNGKKIKKMAMLFLYMKMALMK